MTKIRNSKGAVYTIQNQVDKCKTKISDHRILTRTVPPNVKSLGHRILEFAFYLRFGAWYL
jgi:hypothetical protein